VFQITLTPISDMGDADQVHHYVNGLLGVVAAKVWERHPKTLKEAIDYAVSVEAMGNYGRAAMSSGHRSSGSYQQSHSTSGPMEVNNVETAAGAGDQYGYVDDPQQADPFQVMLSKMVSMEQRLNALHTQGSSFGQERRSGDRTLIPNLKPGDIARMQKEGLCFRCKKKGHMKNECPDRPKV
jgi:hypothetical protein